MSLDNFLSFLQQILTMVDKKDVNSVALAKSALETTVQFAIASKKVDNLTQSVMTTAIHAFDYLVENSKDFAGKPGDLLGNKQNRRKLQMAIMPSC